MQTEFQVGSADPKLENRSDATPNRGCPMYPSISTLSPSTWTLLTETRLRDEIPGHGEYMLLIRLMIADGLRIHLVGDFFSERFTLARYPPLFSIHSEILRSDEQQKILLRYCLAASTEREREKERARRIDATAKGGKKEDG